MAPVPGLPEIRLHQATAQSRLGRLAAQTGDAGPPYWAYPWGGGLALARYLDRVPEAIRGRRALDVGTGSGLVAIAAAKAGAADVLGIDRSPLAIVAARLNAAENCVSARFLCADIDDRPAGDADLVLVGDVFYEAALAVRVLAFLDRCLAAGAAVLIGDPHRAHLPLGRLTRLAEDAVADVAGEAEVPAGVFRLEPARPEPRGHPYCGTR